MDTADPSTSVVVVDAVASIDIVGADSFCLFRPARVVTARGVAFLFLILSLVLRAGTVSFGSAVVGPVVVGVAAGSTRVSCMVASLLMRASSFECGMFNRVSVRETIFGVSKNQMSVAEFTTLKARIDN